MAAAAAVDSLLEAPIPAGDFSSSTASPSPEPPPAADAEATATEPPEHEWCREPRATPAATAIASRYRGYRARRRLLRLSLPGARPCTQCVVEKSSEHVGSLASIYGLNPQTLAHRHVTSHAHGAALCLLCVRRTGLLRHSGRLMM